MGLRARINDELKKAMKARETKRLSTLRLINAAIKDQDIKARAEEGDEGVNEDQIISILSKMVKQRQESARAYEEGGRLELASEERDEITIIEEFLPQPLSEAEVTAAVAAAIAETEANSIRDMGKVMGVLKAKHAGRMDFGKVGGLVKAQLSGL